MQADCFNNLIFDHLTEVLEYYLNPRVLIVFYINLLYVLAYVTPHYTSQLQLSLAAQTLFLTRAKGALKRVWSNGQYQLVNTMS